MNMNKLIKNVLDGTMQNAEFKVDNETAKIYRNSFTECGPTKFFMMKNSKGKKLIAFGQGGLYDELSGEIREEYKICPLSHENRLVFNKYLDYTNPTAFGKDIATVGLGDRLGLATPGHIQLIKDRNIKPVLAQQSIRELVLTGRTYEDVVDSVCYAVIQEGYKGGFGADGDHLKEETDIEMSLSLGFSMITLDCSEKIDNSVIGLDLAEIESRYNTLPLEVRNNFEGTYLDKSFKIADHCITYDRKSLMINILIYRNVLDFIVKVYQKYIKNCGREIDFEISIDEANIPTSYEAHYLVANELDTKKIPVNSVAPRFVGEFQKGIDYIGNLEEFEENIKLHGAIADKFGYKISVHSGSDKFSVFPLISKYTHGRFHLKTAGTNWLEAVRIIAKKDPTLYRKIHGYALEHFSEAKKYYHVTTDVQAICPLEKVSNDDLAGYMDDNNARQLMHITYGILLQAKDHEGKFLFRDAFFMTMFEFEEEYYATLVRHIGRHLDLIGK